MMATHRKSPTSGKWSWLSPWMIIGSVCLLGAILLVLVINNIHREKRFMERALLSEAEVLINSIEAGSRTGMMGMRGWGRRQIQTLLEETAQQPDVLYVALVTPEGKVVADSERERIGSILPFTKPQPGQVLHRFSDGERLSFDVIRAYQPFTVKRHGRHDKSSCNIGGQALCMGSLFGPPQDIYIIVGLDRTPFEEAARQDFRQTILLFGIMLLVGAAGFLSLIWAQNYRSARRSLENIQAFTATLVRQMPVGLITTDLGGRIIETNQAAQQILRKSNRFNSSVAKLPGFAEIATQLTQTDSVIGKEIHYPVTGNECIPLLLNATIIRDRDGKPVGYVYLFSDLTSIKNLEEQLRRSERLASLGRLAAGVAHEIRNPLSSIKGFATIIASKCEHDNSTKKMAVVMKQEVERLNRVISELLDFARPTELNKQRVLCEELFERTLQLVENDAQTHGVKIETQVNPNGLQVEVDPDRFAQILLNLYLNGLQAMENGGTLTIAADESDDLITITVTDTGTGIAAEDLPHIFDPYFTTKPRGVGLGLANVLKLVEAHGGNVEVASSPGEGTRFTIFLPKPNPDRRA